jgi:hypothetical protein
VVGLGRLIYLFTATNVTTVLLFRRGAMRELLRFLSMKSISKHAVAIRMFVLPALVAVVMVTSGPSGALAGQNLHVVPSPFISNSSLSGTAAIADNDIWAVGMIAGATISNDMTLAEHFNGASWGVIATPVLQGAELAAVDGVTSNDVWAVGAQMLRNSSSQALIEHWDGTSWSIVSSPRLRHGGFLTGVTAVSSNDAWAVGTASGSSSALVEHWDGTSWSIVSSPAFTGVGVSGIAADASNDVWAVGARQNCTSMARVGAPSPLRRWSRPGASQCYPLAMRGPLEVGQDRRRPIPRP